MLQEQQIKERKMLHSRNHVNLIDILRHNWAPNIPIAPNALIALNAPITPIALITPNAPIVTICVFQV